VTAAVAPVAVALETATETVGVAVHTDSGLQAELVLTGRRRHVESLTPALEHLLVQVGVATADIGLLAVDVGPGLFTGLRVGVAAAKGLAQALGVGVLCATSLDILTAGAAEAGHHGLVLACVDARRGEVFASVGRLGADEVSPDEVVAPGLFAPANLVDSLARLEGVPLIAVGDGAQRYGALLAEVPGVEVVAPALSFPPPAALLRHALTRIEGGEAPVDGASVVPLYMREADARINFARARA
jgi:tRNA threonylcarbamoyladenosine biosynthesis protein TsaB